jgi:oligopeptide transport system permease protein
MTTVALPLPAPASDRQGVRSSATRLARRHPVAAAALFAIAFFVTVALFAPLIATHDPLDQDLTRTFREPGREHLMGTDILGRDWFSRLVYGTRVSLAVGFFSQALVLGIGLSLGLASGYFGGRVDNLLMRLTDLMYAFPDLLLIILLRSVLGGGIVTLFLIIGLVNWPDMARLVRGQTLSLKQRGFVEAARSLGASDLRLLLRHILPHTLGPLVVVLTFSVPRAIFAEASLGFIGLGLDPGTPSWGSMVHEGYSAIFAFPHLVLFPAGAIALLMLAFTFFGDGLRDAIDPRSRAR